MKWQGIRFWKSILKSCLHDFHMKNIDFNSYALKNGRDLTFTHNMVGDFCCSTCGKKWDSTQIPVIFTYSASQNGGNISMEWFGQACNKKSCPRIYLEPSFDVNRANVVGMKLRQKICEKFYGEEPPKKEFSEESGRAPRKKGHDTSNCKGCEEGVCDQDNFFRGEKRDRVREPPSFHGVGGITKKISWTLEVNGRKHLLCGPNKSQGSTKHRGELLSKSGSKASSKPQTKPIPKPKSKVSSKSEQISKNNGNLPRKKTHVKAAVTDSLEMSLAKLQVDVSEKLTAKHSNTTSKLK